MVISAVLQLSGKHHRHTLHRINTIQTPCYEVTPSDWLIIISGWHRACHGSNVNITSTWAGCGWELLQEDLLQPMKNILHLTATAGNGMLWVRRLQAVFHWLQHLADTAREPFTSHKHAVAGTSSLSAPTLSPPEISITHNHITLTPCSWNIQSVCLHAVST